ncbi:MAG: hypothetical protein COC05_04670 [Gammaproteobacteria bacterium]|nr:MAG: hypothetical protein COC05_04670 [Gammaproteobacteria bacterium]
MVNQGSITQRNNLIKDEKIAVVATESGQTMDVVVRLLLLSEACRPDSGRSTVRAYIVLPAI